MTNPGIITYLSIWLRTTGWMSRRVLRRKTFWWISLSGPVLIWSLIGHFETSVLLLFASTLTYLLPASILMGWTDSELKKRLSVMLHPSNIGTQILLVSEITLPLLAGILPSLIMLFSLAHLSVTIPWQSYVVVPFSALSAVSLILIIENYCRFSGWIGYFILVASQALTGGFADSTLFRILVLPGYTLRTVLWAQPGQSSSIHGDVYVMLAVVEGLVLLFLMLKIMTEKQYSAIES